MKKTFLILGLLIMGLAGNLLAICSLCGEGTAVIYPAVMTHNDTGYFISITYTAGAGAWSAGTFVFVKPAGFPTLSITSSDAGYVTATSDGVIENAVTDGESVSITVDSLMANSGTINLFYGVGSGGGITAPSADTYTMEIMTDPGGVSVADIAVEPTIVVLEPTITVSPTFTVTPTPTFTITQTITPTIVLQCGHVYWSELNSNASFSIRENVSMVTTTAKIYAISGGLIGGGTAEVWVSSDGVDWGAETLSAEFGTMLEQVIFFNNVFYAYPYKTSTDNIWASSDGILWTLATDSRAFKNRTDFSLCVVGDVVYLFGGFRGSEEPASYHGQHNDVWSSTDGVNWTCILSDATNPRDPTRPTQRVWDNMIKYNNKLWLFGGVDVYDAIYYNDVWNSVSGTVWVDVNDNAPFAAGGENGIFIFNNNICVYDHANTDGHVWMSPDGISWGEYINYVGYPYPVDRIQFGTTQWGNSGVIVGGYSNSAPGGPGDLNDVWQFGITYCSPTVTPTITQTSTITSTFTVTSTYTVTSTITKTITVTPTATSTITRTSTVTVQDYQSLLWSAKVYDSQGNTYMAMRNYYLAIYGVTGYLPNKANDLQDIYYRAGLMLVNKFKILTSYDITSKNIAKINAPSVKATAIVKFVATMTPVYSLLSEADIHLWRGQAITGAAKDLISIKHNRDYIHFVATYIATY